MKVALDTNAYTGFMRGEPATVQVVRAASEIVLPLIVLAELRAGFAAGISKPRTRRVSPAFSLNPGRRLMP